MSERSFEEFMERSIGLDFSIGDVFEMSMDEAEQKLDEYSQKFNVKTNKIKNLFLDPMRFEVKKEMIRLRQQLSPELHRKIDLLLQAAFVAGQDTSDFFSANLISSLKSKGAEASLQEISLWLDEKNKERQWGKDGGKAPKRNHVLVKIFKTILRKFPDTSYADSEKLIIGKAQTGHLKCDGYDIGYQEKGELGEDGEILKEDHLVFWPETKEAHKKKLRSKSIRTLRRYYDNVKKSEW